MLFKFKVIYLLILRVYLLEISQQEIYTTTSHKKLHKLKQHGKKTKFLYIILFLEHLRKKGEV